MGGGLINIVSYSSNDLFLTGSPQITFYKMVYRRYTNFAMESIFVDFDNRINFGNETELIPPRIADLIHKAYLHIEIPEMGIRKTDIGINTTDIVFKYANNNVFDDYSKIKNIYMKVITDIYKVAYKAVKAINVAYSGFINDIRTYINTGNNSILLDEYNLLLTVTMQRHIATTGKYTDILAQSNSNLWTIIGNINTNILYTSSHDTVIKQGYINDSNEYYKALNTLMKNTVFKELQKGLDNCIKVQKYFFDQTLALSRNIEIDTNSYIKSAWVKNLGHSIIEYIDVYIGGNRIDRHYGTWINIWYQLTYKYNQIDIYNKLIGNVPELTNFDNSVKPSYNLYIPLSFWFTKFNGLSFPLVAMQYNDIRFNVKLRKIEDVFYIERLYRAEYNGIDTTLTAGLINFITKEAKDANINSIDNIDIMEDISLTDLWESSGKQLRGHIIFDYIYLDSSERKRFAQSGHEYLIERIQTDIFDNIQQNDIDIQLDFTNPSKEIIWIMTKDIHNNNETSWNECKWDNYTTGDTNKNPISYSSLMISNYTRIEKRDSLYFNMYQPLIYHKVTPSIGINLYSFALEPLQQQPTGSCNFTKLTNSKLFLNIDPQIYRYNDNYLYPYDESIDFILTLEDTDKFLESVDILFIEQEIVRLDLLDSLIRSQSLYKNELLELQNAYNLIKKGSNKIKLSHHRRMIHKTNTTIHVFSLTINILRLIGGYGALAYSGNN